MDKTPILASYFKNPENIMEGKEYFGQGESSQDRKFVLYKRIECKDGFNMSVQANFGTYCTPRVTLHYSGGFIYSAMEVGFPSKKESLLMPYAEEKERPTETVYGYVPVEIIEKVIVKHGGLT